MKSQHCAGFVVVVSGLPRSGTSMAMRMLEAGGMELLTDQVRLADEDNLGGYFEFEAVKRLEHDSSWVVGAQGRAVKVISFLLKHLPPDVEYRVIFLRRRMDEILASQRAMLVRRGEAKQASSDDDIRKVFESHLEAVLRWIGDQPNMRLIEIDYNEVMANPAPAMRRIRQFLDADLDTEAMIRSINSKYYRNRAGVFDANDEKQ